MNHLPSHNNPHNSSLSALDVFLLTADVATVTLMLWALSQERKARRTLRAMQRTASSASSSAPAPAPSDERVQPVQKNGSTNPVSREGHPAEDAPAGSAAKSHPEASVEAERRHARREDVIAVSRQKYARPRAEVEREIAQMMGWDQPPYTPAPTLPEIAEEARRLLSRLREGKNGSVLIKAEHALKSLGLSADEVHALLSSRSLERILQQIAWLPQRRPRYPAILLRHAIEKNWGPPRPSREDKPNSKPDSKPDSKPNRRSS
jgi:hypothetical protein